MPNVVAASAITANPAPSTEATNREALLAKMTTAKAVNDHFVALASPTNAEVIAQVRALSKLCNALLLLQSAALSSTAGT